eukprot:TRINITY_DN16121_c0_g1_i1.p1 TRINITY_DN16121_c0_g1~~TRINITY_DN16121_c0_g1_i1.p1  ORF type:complete len:303 (+),score=54.41 TRINITY_DN16121_c0_g1_i1:41-910(+)
MDLLDRLHAEAAPPVWKARNDGLETRKDMLSRVRRKIFAAKSRVNISWHELFTLCDKNRSSTLDWNEYKEMARGTLKILPQTVCDFELRELFSEIDKDGSGYIGVAELLLYIQHGPSRQEDENSKKELRLRRVQRNMQMAWQKLSANEADVRNLVKKMDLDSDNYVSRFEFNQFVRHDLKLTRWDVMANDLEDFYDYLDRNSDGLTFREIMHYVKKAEKDKNMIGAHALYISPNNEKPRRFQTQKKKLLDGFLLSNSRSLPDLGLSSPFSALGRDRKPTTRASLSMPML